VLLQFKTRKNEFITSDISSRVDETFHATDQHPAHLDRVLRFDAQPLTFREAAARASSSRSLIMMMSHHQEHSDGLSENNKSIVRAKSIEWKKSSRAMIDMVYRYDIVEKA
jgi:hypothetical protein